MLTDIINFVLDFVEGAGYMWIFIMMTLESSFFPFPSEAAMVPAWALAASWKMSFSLALLAWIVWSLVWAFLNYSIWKYLWKGFIIKFWKYVFFKEHHYNKVENYFINHWSITTFVGRFIPAVRQYISFPAWVVSMNIPKFLFYTGLWAWLWSLILMIIWYLAWKNKDLIVEYKFYALWWLLVMIIIVVAIYVYYHRKFASKENLEIKES